MYDTDPHAHSTDSYGYLQYKIKCIYMVEIHMHMHSTYSHAYVRHILTCEVGKSTGEPEQMQARTERRVFVCVSLNYAGLSVHS